MQTAEKTSENQEAKIPVQERRRMVQEALKEYESNGGSLALLAKKYGVSYNTLYMHSRKTLKKEKKTNYAFGRKTKYDEQTIQHAINDCLSGINIQSVASRYGIKYSTLRTYLSLYRTQNKEVKCMLVRIEKMKNRAEEKSETVERSVTEPAKPEITLPYSYKIKDGKISVDYIIEVGDDIQECVFDFVIKNSSLHVSLSGFVYVFGKKENIVFELFNTLSETEKIPAEADIYKSPFRDYIASGYFPVNSVLENMRALRIRPFYAEMLASVYMFIKDNKANIEKLLLQSL